MFVFATDLTQRGASWTARNNVIALKFTGRNYCTTFINDLWLAVNDICVF